MSLLGRVFVWRERRKQRKRGYQLDSRRYRSGLGPGFFSFLENTRFWESLDNPRGARSQIVRIILIILAIAGVILAGWVLIESIRALRIYR